MFKHETSRLTQITYFSILLVLSFSIIGGTFVIDSDLKEEKENYNCDIVFENETETFEKFDIDKELKNVDEFEYKGGGSVMTEHTEKLLEC